MKSRVFEVNQEISKVLGTETFQSTVYWCTSTESWGHVCSSKDTLLEYSTADVPSNYSQSHVNDRSCL